MMALIPLLFILSLSSCDQDYVPKPRGDISELLFRKKAYTTFSPRNLSFSIWHSGIFWNSKRSLTQKLNPAGWILNSPKFKATVYLSYKDVKGFEQIHWRQPITFFKHISKASGIEEANISIRFIGIRNKLPGKRNAASSYQFFLTDSTHHFLRGSLYFYAILNLDSLAPVNDFITKTLNILSKLFAGNRSGLIANIWSYLNFQETKSCLSLEIDCVNQIFYSESCILQTKFMVMRTKCNCFWFFPFFFFRYLLQNPSELKQTKRKDPSIFALRLQ